MNPELEKRKEFERRKKLRLLQVRQQSKQFADELREKIKGEITLQKKKYMEAENKLKQEKHLQELCQLKELYDRCLQSVGKGHKEAAMQPDINEEKQAELNKISVRASRRGAKAIKKQLEDEACLKQKIEAPVKQKKAIRNKENLRAFFVSSLPKPVGDPGTFSAAPSKSSPQNTEPQKARSVLQNIPSNLPGCRSRVSDLQNHNNPETENDYRNKSKCEYKDQYKKKKLPEEVTPVNKPEDCVSNVSSRIECSCDYVVCSCHKSPTELRRCSSESRISSEKGFDLEEPKKGKVRSRSCSPRSVRTLNYFDCGNVYESNQRSFVRVTHHSISPKLIQKTEDNPKSNAVEDFPLKLSIQETKKRTEERSEKALKKEKLKRDFQQLIRHLKKLSQEKSAISSKTKGKLRVFSSERDILKRKEKKQRKLNDAFEKLPRCINSVKNQNTGAEKRYEIPANDSSPPTLNLALYQTNTPSPHTVETSIPTSYRSDTTSKIEPKTTMSSSKARSSSPNVLIDRDPSGDVHITVKVSEMLGGKSRSQERTMSTGRSVSQGRSRSPESPASHSSYMSPPMNLTPSQQELLDALLRQVNKRAIGDEMKKYITQLLSMSRDGIDELRGSSKSPDMALEEDLEKLTELAEIYASKVSDLVDMYEQMDSPSGGDYVDPIRGPPGSTPLSPRGVSPAATRAGVSRAPGRSRATPSGQGPSQTAASPRVASFAPSSASSADTNELLFGGFGGRMPPPLSDSQLADFVARHPEGFGEESLPEDYDLEADVGERWRKLLAEQSTGPTSPGAVGGEAVPLLDIPLDYSALEGPLDPNRVNALRETLSGICTDQYRGIIEMLKKDTSNHQLKYEELLKRATSDPFLDPNATLAPIHPVEQSYAGTEYTLPRHMSRPGTPSTLDFSRTGRTPPGELRGLQNLSPGSPEFQTTPQYAEFDDPFSNIDTLMILVRSQQKITID